MKDLTSPSEIKTKNSIKDKVYIMELIEKEFENDRLWDTDQYVSIIIQGEYPINTREEVIYDYIKRGWSKIEHKTSSENGERYGLTSFKFYF